MDTQQKERSLRGFRLPCKQFCQLLNLLEKDERFWRWWKGSCKGADMATSTLLLLLLGSLCYLGHGWTFNNIEENTAISKQVHCVFVHKFINYCSATLFDKYVIAPTKVEEARTHITDSVIAGIPGCVSSTDATHIAMSCCPHQIRHIHKGFKLHLAWVLVMIVNPTRMKKTSSITKILLPQVLVLWIDLVLMLFVSCLTIYLHKNWFCILILILKRRRYRGRNERIALARGSDNYKHLVVLYVYSSLFIYNRNSNRNSSICCNGIYNSNR